MRTFLFPDGGHCFLGGVIQVLCWCDWQAALSQNPLGLVDVGPWKTQEDSVTAGDNNTDRDKGTRRNKLGPNAPSENHGV